jgi:hypothetical protein
MGEKRNAYSVLVGKPEGTTSLGIPKCRCVDSMKVDLREIRWDRMDWIYLALASDQWNALVNTLMKLRNSQNAGEFLSSCRIGGFSISVQLH